MVGSGYQIGKYSDGVTSYPVNQGGYGALSTDGLTAVEGGSGDSSGIGAAWVFLGPARAAGTPAPQSASPASGTGTTTSFAFTFSDTAGYQDLTLVDVLIRDAPDGRHAR